MCGASAKKAAFFSNDKHSTHSFGLDRLYNMNFSTVKKRLINYLFMISESKESNQSIVRDLNINSNVKIKIQEALCFKRRFEVDRSVL